MPITVGIIEDDAGYRGELEHELSCDPALSCRGGWANAESALKDLASGRPNVLLVDIHLPGMTGIDLVRHLRKKDAGRTQYVMLTADGDSQQICEAIKAGATGYLLKGATVPRVGDAVADVHAGGSPMSSPIARKVLQAFGELSRQASEVARLTSVELEALQLAAQGYIDKEIAVRTGRTEHAIRNRFQRIFRKLHVRSRWVAISRLRSAEFHDRRST